MLVIVSTLVGLEVAGQLFVWRLTGQWEAMKTQEDHYYAPVDNRLLAYGLTPGVSLIKEGRTLHINRHGIRDDDDNLHADKRKIALLGDSVAFGIGHSQDQTIAAKLQARLDTAGPAVKVLNFGVPGYGLDEILEHLKVKNAMYAVDRAIYILNLNDFSRRDSMYEGAANGLYRMYRRPRIAGLWILRKLVYRLRKGSLRQSTATTIGWYRWLFDGNGAHGCSQLREMKAYCDANGIAFTVVLLPAGCAYIEGQYTLADIHQKLREFAERNSIDMIDTAPLFAADPQRFFDETDHFLHDGDELMAEILADRLRTAAPNN